MGVILFPSMLEEPRPQTTVWGKKHIMSCKLEILIFSQYVRFVPIWDGGKIPSCQNVGSTTSIRAYHIIPKWK